MCWISTTKEETTAALKQMPPAGRGAGQTRPTWRTRGEGRTQTRLQAPGSQLHEHTHTQATFSILRGNYFNWKFYTALLTKFEGIMNSWFFFNFYQKRTQWATHGYSPKESGVAKYQKDSEEPPWPPQSAVWASRTAEKDLLCQLHRTRDKNPPLKRKSPKQVTEPNSTYAHTWKAHICVWQGREVTILIPEKVDFRSRKH